jgi:hypothetical protein
MTIDYHLWSVMNSLLIFKYNISHGTMKYTLQAHVYYYVFMAWLLHYLYSFHPDFYTLENIQKVVHELSYKQLDVVSLRSSAIISI